MAFTPATYKKGEAMVMPVTFPDGACAELVYQPELDLKSFRVQPFSSGYIPGFGRDLVVYDRPLGDVFESFDHAELFTEYENGRGDTVGFWRLPDGLYLAFEFGSWTVLVYDYGDAQMSEYDRQVWATSFRGRETNDGFLVLDSEPPLIPARAGDHAGPELDFWSRAGHVRGILLFPGECRPYQEGENGFEHIEAVNGLMVSRDSDDFASWCVPGESMTVHVYQDPGDTFIDDVLSGVHVRNVSLAS